jgi:hypothetical protein
MTKLIGSETLKPNFKFILRITNSFYFHHKMTNFLNKNHIILLFYKENLDIISKTVILFLYFISKKSTDIDEKEFFINFQTKSDKAEGEEFKTEEVGSNESKSEEVGSNDRFFTDIDFGQTTEKVFDPITGTYLTEISQSMFDVLMEDLHNEYNEAKKIKQKEVKKKKPKKKNPKKKKSN